MTHLTDALELLELSAFLEGEVPPVTLGGMEHFTPDGVLIGGDLRRQTEVVHLHRMESESVVQEQVGTLVVSTVYLGMNHGWRPGGPALIWETMIFGDEAPGCQWRYATRAAAMAGHEQVKRAVAALIR